MCPFCSKNEATENSYVKLTQISNPDEQNHIQSQEENL